MEKIAAKVKELRKNKKSINDYAKTFCDMKEMNELFSNDEIYIMLKEKVGSKKIIYRD